MSAYHHLRFVAVILIVGCGVESAQAVEVDWAAVVRPLQSSDRPPAGAVRLEVEADAEQSSDRPVRIRIRLTNTGTTDLSFWSGGPGDYPNATDFYVHVADADGVVTRLDAQNGQVQMGSGWGIPVDAGKSVEVPALVHNPGEGLWTLVAACGDGRWPRAMSTPVKIRILRSEALTARYDRWLTESIRAKDTFATTILAAATFDRLNRPPTLGQKETEPLYPPEVLASVVEMLDSDDWSVIQNASYGLYLSHPKSWPAGTGKRVLECYHRYLSLEDKPWNVSFYLAAIATGVKDADARQALIDITADPQPDIRVWGLRYLGALDPDASSKAAMQAALKDPVDNVRTEAATQVIFMGDPSPAPLVLAALNDGNIRSRCGFDLLYALTFLPPETGVPVLERMSTEEKSQQWREMAGDLLARRNSWPTRR